MKSNNETEEPLFYKYYNQLLEDTVMNQSQTQDFLYNSLIKDLNWESVIEESKKTQKSTCGKPIKEGELCFQCMDCAILKENHLLCEECFCKVDHRNHRVKFKNSIWGYCDCGDEDAILNSAFCISHQSKIINEREIRKQIPKITRDKLNNSLNFLFLKCLHEAEDEIKVLNTVEKIFFVGEKVIRQLNCLFSSISKMIDDSFRILIFLANFLIKPLNQKKIDNAFFHECDLIDDLTFSTGGKKPCKCSILGIIFKFNQFLSEELRNQIVEVIFKLSPSTFLKEHIIFLMLRNINQIIELKLIKSQDPQNEKVIFSVSQFTKLHLFYIINKDIAEKFVVSQEFNNVICKIKREYLIQDSPFHEEISRSIRNTIIFYLWKFANLKKITELFFENPKILQELFIILLSVKPKEEKFDKPKEVSFLNTNYVFFLFIKKMLKLLNDDENEMKKIGIMTKIFEKLLIDIFFCSINEKTNLLFLRESNQLMKDIHFMNHISSKLFGLFMGFFIQNFDYKFAKLNDFLINLLQKSNIKISHFTSTFTTQLILTLFSKYSITISKGNNILIIYYL